MYLLDEYGQFFFHKKKIEGPFMKVSYTGLTQHKTTGECTVYSNVQNISHKAML